MRLKKMLSKVPSWSLWVGAGVLLLGGVFLFSVKTYLSSLSTKEVKIAEVSGYVSNPIILKGFKKEGSIRSSMFVLKDDVKFIFDFKSRVYAYNISRGTYEDAEFKVKPGDEVELFLSAVSDVSTIMYGYVPPDGKKCGLPPYVIIDISEYIDKVKSYGEEIIDIQCWNEHEEVNNPVEDFNDAVVIFSYAPQSAVASPSPSPNASPSPSPNASPSPSPNASPSPSPNVSPSPSPLSDSGGGYVSPTQPDTGTPTGLTLGLFLGLVSLLALKLKIGEDK